MAFVGVVADRDNPGPSRFYVFHIGSRNVLAVPSACRMAIVAGLSEDSNYRIVIDEAMMMYSCLEFINAYHTIDHDENAAYPNFAIDHCLVTVQSTM